VDSEGRLSDEDRDALRAARVVEHKAILLVIERVDPRPFRALAMLSRSNIAMIEV
jgi:hypothetical protein